MKIFGSVAMCVAFVSFCGCEKRNPTSSFASDYPKPLELPESADAMGMEFKLISAGTFIMGEGEEAHEVTLTKPFRMGVHEVTQDQFEQLMVNNPSEFKSANNPVDRVFWDEAVEFCRRLSELPAEKAAGNVYRLPTEAEWEYACRAGTTTNYSFGDDASELADYGWYKDNSYLRKTHSVGAKKPNPWGLHDMHGNVSEWCQDWYGQYPSDAVTDPTGPPLPSGRMGRVLRGGSMISPASSQWSAQRARQKPSGPYRPVEYHATGFRVCLSPSGK